MIRDPSDGTVREVEHQPKRLETQVDRSENPLLSTTSGLATDKLKSDELARLAASREWVKNWHQRKTEKAGESNEPT